jgi:ribosomal protein S12 methylthiotransferase accessory factor
VTIATPHLRLPPDAIAVATSRGIALYSDSGAILVEGADVGLLTEMVFPLLDGTRTTAELFAAVQEIDPPDLVTLLQTLQDHGLLDYDFQPQSVATDHARRRLLLQNAGIVIAGVEPWLTLSAQAVRAAGVGHVSSILEGASPSYIAIGVFPESDAARLRHFVDYVKAREMQYLVCVIGAKEVHIGPFVVPRRSACWNCARLRSIANAKWKEPDPDWGDPSSEIDALIGALLAREVCGAITQNESSCRLVNHLLVLDKLSLQVSLHRVLRVPGCEVCQRPTEGDPKDANREENAASVLPDEVASQLLSWFVDPRTGIVNRVVVEDAAAAGVESPIIVSAIPADVPSESLPRRCMPVGWGKGITLSAAIIGAVGEAIERYSAFTADTSRIIWSRPAELSGDVLDPRSLALYSNEQYGRSDFPFVRFDPEVRHPWVAGEWMGNHRPVWIPAILTYLSLEVRPEHVFCQGTSNGLAAGTNRSEAALRAILELLERDAFMTSWRSKRAGQHLLLDQGLDSDLVAVLAGIQAFGVQVELILLPSACGYPTALCLGFGDGVNWPGATLGLGTDPDARAAVRQAILELGQTGPYLRRLMNQKAYPVAARKWDVKQMLDHASYYFPPEHASAFDYLRHAGNPCSLADLPQRSDRSLSACSQALEMSHIRVALVEVTSPDIATTPVHVLRAISPDLQAISFGYGLDRQSVPRLAALNPVMSAWDIAPIW